MKRHILVSSLIIFLFRGGLVIAEQLPYKEGQLLMRFANVAGRPLAGNTKETILNSIIPGCCVGKEYDGIVQGLTLVNLPSGTTVADALPLFSQSSAFLYVEPNYKLELAATPDDSRFSELWGMHNTGQTGGTDDADIDAPEAWDTAVGSSDVIVAVTDTGVDYTHPDLAANMWVNTAELNGSPGVDDDGNGYVDDIYGYDFVGADVMNPQEDGDPMDYHGHGTHVSGTVGAVGNNNNGVTGVCWDVSIMALKIFDHNGLGLYASDAVGSIQYAVDNDADVINASWGGYSYSQSIKDAIAATDNAGLLFVAAAHNYSMDNDETPLYPASYDLDNIVSVLSTDHDDELSSFSNYGATSVDLGAPGSDILSSMPGGSYGTMSGT